MSEVKQSRRERMRERMAPRKQRADELVKTWEWTWTNSIVFSIGLVFVIWISMAVIPSFWTYFAEQTLGWDGASDIEVLFTATGWQPIARDAVAMGLSTGPLITILVAAAIMQNWRRKLRGQTDARPTGGYR
ncbi:MAG: hypothetical protein WEA10_09005 [Actinomycetota bacterium]